MAATAQQKALAIAPKVTAFLSIVGSSLICYQILLSRSGADDGHRSGSGGPGRSRGGGRHQRSKLRKTYHRLVLGLSVCDLIASIAWFFTSFPIPTGTPGVYGAVGNQATCTAQGFFTQFSLSCVFYNLSLAIYYLLVIVHGWKEERIARIEPFLHLNALLWGAGTAAASAYLGLLNPVGWDCWISSKPLGCQESWKSPDGTTTCERGDNASMYQWLFYYAPLWFVIVLVTAIMVRVYAKVRAQERATERYHAGGERSGVPSTTVPAAQNDDGKNGDGRTTMQRKQQQQQQASSRQKHSRKIANQAMFYVGAFFVAWTPPTIFQIVLVSDGTVYYPLLFLTALLVPIQGFLNVLVYMRPKYLTYRNRHPGGWAVKACFVVLKRELGCVSRRGGNTSSNDDLPTSESEGGSSRSGISHHISLAGMTTSFFESSRDAFERRGSDLYKSARNLFDRRRESDFFDGTPTARRRNSFTCNPSSSVLVVVPEESDGDLEAPGIATASIIEDRRKSFRRSTM